MRSAWFGRSALSLSSEWSSARCLPGCTLQSSAKMKSVHMAFRLADRRAAMAAMAVAGGALLAAAEARTEGRPHALVAHHWPQRREPKRGAPLLPQCADLQQLYRVDSVIGRGGFGLVHQGRDKKSDAPVAIKRVCKQTTSKAKFLQEVEILRAMSSHDNVVTLCEAFETTDSYVLVTELVDGEELFDHLVNHGVFSERRAQALVREVASTLAFLHENGVVHGDLKPENILVTDDSSQMRLIDFGQSFREHILSERARCLRSGVATIAYAAPEVIQAAKSGTPRSTGYAFDMWGLGVVLYILLCGFHPFDPDNDATDLELAQRIVSGAYDTDSPEWKELPTSARDLIERLLQVDPLRRVSAGGVLAHEWLATKSAM